MFGLGPLQGTPGYAKAVAFSHGWQYDYPAAWEYAGSAFTGIMEAYKKCEAYSPPYGLHVPLIFGALSLVILADVLCIVATRTWLLVPVWKNISEGTQSLVRSAA